MDADRAVLAFAALSQQTRLEVLRLLMAYEPNGLPAGDVARQLAVAPNTLSAHLAVLGRAGLVTSERRSRSIIYRAQVATVRALTSYLAETCCSGRADLCNPNPGATRSHPGGPVDDRIYNVLFLCTGNSARSILAESILRKDGAGRFRAFSAGSRPKGEVDPFALKVLDRGGYPTAGMRSKSWSEFAVADAPVMDFVFTVCDSAAGEACPVWPGQPMTAHWGIEDPAAVSGADILKETAFVTAFKYLKNRISLFRALPIASLDQLALGERLRDIGRIEGATGAARELAK